MPVNAVREPVGPVQLPAQPVQAVNLPQTTAPVDQFEPSSASSSAAPQTAPDFAPMELEQVKAFQLQLDEKRRASEISDAFMTCLNPVISKSGPIEQQVYFILFRILAKIEADRAKNGLDYFRLERIKNALQGKEALAALQKIETKLDAEQKTRSDDQNRAAEGLMTATRILNDALTTTLREMRGA